MNQFQRIALGLLVGFICLAVTQCVIVWLTVSVAGPTTVQNSVDEEESEKWTDQLPVEQSENLQAKLPRSYRWQVFREEQLLVHRYCAVCGTEKAPQLHHIKSFHQHPELECDPCNVIRLCGFEANGCHFYWGHDPDGKGPRKPNFKLTNPNIVADAAAAWGD